MRPMLAAALCAFLCAGPTAALAQDEDDWEFAEDPTRNLTVAAARYDAGAAVIVLCRDGVLTTVLNGLPTAARYELQATRADGRSDTQVWVSAGADGAVRSSVPARDARFLRGGGAYVIRTIEGQTPVFRTSFDLPTQFANLDRVLSACGWPAVDDRDALPQIRDLLIEVSGARRSEPPPQRIVNLSCLERNRRLYDCRVDRDRGAGREADAASASEMDGTRVRPTGSDSIPRGGVVYTVATAPE